MRKTIFAAALLMAVSASGQVLWNSPAGFSNYSYNYQNRGYWGTGPADRLWSAVLFPAQVFNAGASLIADGIRNVSWAVHDGYRYGYDYGYGHRRTRYGASAWDSRFYDRPAYQPAPVPPPVLWQNTNYGQYSQIALFDTRPQPQCGWKQSTSLVTEFYWENGAFQKDSSGNYITRQVQKTSWVWSCQ